MDTLHSGHDVSAHATECVEVDCLAVFVALAHGIQNGPTAKHSSENHAEPGLASECETPFASHASELAAAETPIAPTRRPSAARNFRSVVRREDILEELHVAVRLREAPLPRGQKLQSSWD